MNAAATTGGPGAAPGVGKVGAAAHTSIGRLGTGLQRVKKATGESLEAAADGTASALRRAGTAAAGLGSSAYHGTARAHAPETAIPAQR